jgi:4-hydroxy-tetrahydrodipicolinate synthase
MTAMVTPFDGNGAVDFEALKALVEKCIAEEADTLVVTGSTGEGATLDTDEKMKLYAEVVKLARGRVKVMAGTGTNNTKQSIELTRQAEATGVDGIMLVVPYYNKPPQDALIEHFNTIARTTNLPIMLYNVPGRTASNMLPKTVATLSEVENIVALKDAAGNMDQTTETLRLVRPGFRVYSGDDSLTLPMLSLGAVGVVSVASHLVGSDIKRMINLHQAGRVQEAAELHRKLYPVFKAMFVTTNPVPLKAALNLIGVKVGGLRLPLKEAGPAEVEAVKKALGEYGIRF